MNAVLLPMLAEASVRCGGFAPVIAGRPGSFSDRESCSFADSGCEASCKASATISPASLRTGLAKLGFQLSDDQFHAVYDKLDKDSSHEI